VTVRFEAYLSMLDELMAKLEMPKKTTGFFCEDFSMTLPVLPYHPRKVMERHMEIYLEYYRYDGINVKASSQLIYDHARSVYNQDLEYTPFKISDKYAVVIESSESATYITPYYNGEPVRQAVKRYSAYYLEWMLEENSSPTTSNKFWVSDTWTSRIATDWSNKLRKIYVLCLRIWCKTWDAKEDNSWSILSYPIRISKRRAMLRIS